MTTPPTETNPVAIVQARIGGSRFPRKVLQDICGLKLIERQMERMLASEYLGKRVAVAIPSTPENDPLEEECRAHGWICVRGPEHDVLSRYVGALDVLEGASGLTLDPVIRMTMDCPLIDPGVIDRVIHTYLTGDYDYVSNNLEKSFPHGYDVECFSAAALRRADSEMPDSEQSRYMREHVTLPILQDPRSKLGNLKLDLSRFTARGQAIILAARLTVDYPEDLALVRAVYREYEDLEGSGRRIDLRDIVNFFERCPEVMALNEHRALDHAAYLKDSETVITKRE